MAVWKFTSKASDEKNVSYEECNRAKLVRCSHRACPRVCDETAFAQASDEPRDHSNKICEYQRVKVKNRRWSFKAVSRSGIEIVSHKICDHRNSFTNATAST